MITLNKKIMAGICAVIMTAGVFTGCGNKTAPAVSETTSVTTIAENMDDYFSVYAETEPVVDEAANAETITEETTAETTVTSALLTEALEEDANAKEIRAMLEEMFELNGNVAPDDFDAIYDYVDLDVLYYMAKGERADKETIINYLKEQGESADISSLTMTGSPAANCKNVIVSVTPLSAEENEVYRKFLDIQSSDELSAYMAEKTGFDVTDEDFSIDVADTEVNKEDADKLASKYVPFSEMKKQFNITDVYCATIQVTASEPATTSSEKTDASLEGTPVPDSDNFKITDDEEKSDNTYDDLDSAFGAIADDILDDDGKNAQFDFSDSSFNFDMSMTFYVFKIDGKWKLDLPYSLESIVIEMFSGFGDMFGTEDDYDIDFNSDFSDIMKEETDGEMTDAMTDEPAEKAEETTRVIIN